MTRPTAFQATAIALAFVLSAGALTFATTNSAESTAVPEPGTLFIRVSDPLITNGTCESVNITTMFYFDVQDYPGGTFVAIQPDCSVHAKWSWAEGGTAFNPAQGDIHVKATSPRGNVLDLHAVKNLPWSCPTYISSEAHPALGWYNSVRDDLGEGEDQQGNCIAYHNAYFHYVPGQNPPVLDEDARDERMRAWIGKKDYDCDGFYRPYGQDGDDFRPWCTHSRSGMESAYELVDRLMIVNVTSAEEFTIPRP